MNSEKLAQAKQWFEERKKAFEKQPELAQICEYYDTAVKAIEAVKDEWQK